MKAQVEQVGKDVEDKDGALVLGIELMVKSHRPAHGLRNSLVVALVFHGDRAQVVRVGEVVHGAERDVHFSVHVFVAILDDVFEHSGDLVGNAVEPHFFAERVLP
jgi:hypothetical protein